MTAERCSKTTDVMVLAAMAVCFGSSCLTPSGSSQRLRLRTQDPSCIGCLTTVSRWGRRSWPLLVGRMRWYRVGRTWLYTATIGLLTSRNTVYEALWMVTNGRH
jgi:hypothetical protein